LPLPAWGLDQALLPEIVVGLGKVPLVRYATPGTPDLSAVLEPFIPHYDALLLLANHGAVTSWSDLFSAFRMETLEHFAKIMLTHSSSPANLNFFPRVKWPS
jgi:L-fuculose-phosphate aldolase